MANGIITGFILCIIILEMVQVAEADLADDIAKCVDDCMASCTKKFPNILCEGGCKFVYCLPPAATLHANTNGSDKPNDPAQSNESPPQTDNQNP
uniref:Uncharacterized protein n=1 Tax=Fagus sylvatica TaxID=28930 RepID=A0A2N9GMX7_FAGSY